MRGERGMTRSPYSFRQPGMPLKSLPLPESFRAEEKSKIKRQNKWRDLGEEGQREVWRRLGGVPRRTRRPAQTYTCSLCCEPGKSKSASCPTCKHTSGLMHLKCLAKSLVFCGGGKCPFCRNQLGSQLSGVKVPDRPVPALETSFAQSLHQEEVVDETTLRSMGQCLFCEGGLGEGEEVGVLRGELDLPLKVGVCGRCRRFQRRSCKKFFYPTLLNDGTTSVRVGSF